MSRPSPRETSRWVTIAVWVAIGAAAVSLIMAAAVGWVADGAIRLGHIERATTAAELSRVQLSATLLLAEQARLGLATPAQVQEAAEAVAASLDLLEQSVRSLSDERAAAAPYLTSARSLLAGLGNSPEPPDPEAVAESLEQLTTTLNAGRLANEQQLVVLRSESAPLMLVATFVVVLAGPLAIIGAHQSWANRRLEASQLRQRLLASEEVLTSKNEFLANVSHELRTPLTGIYGLTRLLENESLDPHERRELIGLISQESGELLRMVDDILTLGRSDAGVLTYQPQLLSPGGEVQLVLESYQWQEGPTAVDCQPGPVWVDPLRLRQLLRNLVGNAHRHGGGTIEVVGRVTPAGYRLVVRDDGPGVPDHLLSSLFSRFLHRDSTPLLAGSIGLGLHIARLLAEGMGGGLTYERRNGWTEFVVTLPMSGAEAVAETTELAYAV
ncbi:MAG TPA: HAMP domain-containing sensor histidine kinase [Acidimicrobiia bacterium]|nr:HAMP domain-containing sensor histidine kinase [Acidimicrobiia bacterium]